VTLCDACADLHIVELDEDEESRVISVHEDNIRED